MCKVCNSVYVCKMHDAVVDIFICHAFNSIKTFSSNIEDIMYISVPFSISSWHFDWCSQQQNGQAAGGFTLGTCCRCYFRFQWTTHYAIYCSSIERSKSERRRRRRRRKTGIPEVFVYSFKKFHVVITTYVTNDVDKAVGPSRNEKTERKTFDSD